MKKIKISCLFLILFQLNIFLLSCAVNIEDASTMIDMHKELVVHFIDVGQADSILIQLPNGEVSLIDGGNREDSDTVIEYLEKQGIKTIDYLIATHPHEDHIGGLVEIIKSFNIKKIYMPKVTTNTKTFENLLETISEKKLKAIVARGGTAIIEANQWSFIIIAPNSDKYDEINEYSVVTKLTYKNTSFLFMGDAEKVSENEILDIGYDISTDVIKIGHHGGKTSTTGDFLDNSNPEYAVITVGKDNEYGHPYSETIERLSKRKINVIRTDQNGNIVICSNGEDIKIK